MPSSSYLKIDTNAILENLNLLKKKTQNIMPMVKANAYGTDAIALSKIFASQDVPMLGVSHVEEGIALRKSGIEMPIFVLSSPLIDAERIVRFDLQPAVSSESEVLAVDTAAKKYRRKILVHVHVNTGMNRFGITPNRTPDLVKKIQEATSLQFHGIMTHFAAADSPEFDSFSHEQISLFHEVVTHLSEKPKWIHMANSSGALRFSLPFCNLARIGLALFGYGTASNENLKPALSLYSYLSSISTCKKGETIGYDRAYINEKEMATIGIVPFGYHDGLHRSYSGKNFVLINNKPAPILGKICMDFIMVDITEHPSISVGDPVVFFNTELRPEDVAKRANTDVREFLACLGPRVKRILSHSS